MLRLYAAIGWVLHPLLLGWLLWRARNGKEDRARLYERFGKARLARPQGKLVWVHAASVGESQSVLPLIERMLKADSGLHILLTTGTVSSAELMQSRLPERAMHQYVPVDTPLAARRFIRHWKPDVVLWVESELWPTLLSTIDSHHVPRLLINARLSERSYHRWQRLRKHFHHMMQPFKYVICGSTHDQKRLKRLGIEKAEYAGNLKYDVAPLPYDAKAMGELVSLIGDRRVWLAASTHPGEEEQILATHNELKETFDQLLTIIVPRHPRRSDEIASLVSLHKMTAAVRSKNHRIIEETDVYLADTLGELGMFYRLVGVVFMGGSLVPHGGHNPIEPAMLDCAIACGPHMHNFAEVVDDLRCESGISMVEDAHGLAQQIAAWLSDHEKQEGMAQRAHAAMDERAGGAETILSYVLPLLGIAHKKEDENAA